jgi:hypothetical protein
MEDELTLLKRLYDTLRELDLKGLDYKTQPRLMVWLQAKLQEAQKPDGPHHASRTGF